MPQAPPSPVNRVTPKPSVSRTAQSERTSHGSSTRSTGPILSSLQIKGYACPSSACPFPCFAPTPKSSPLGAGTRCVQRESVLAPIGQGIGSIVSDTDISRPAPEPLWASLDQHGSHVAPFSLLFPCSPNLGPWPDAIGRLPLESPWPQFVSTQKAFAPWVAVVAPTSQW